MSKAKKLIFLIENDSKALISFFTVFSKLNACDFYSHPNNEFLQPMIKEQAPDIIIGTIDLNLSNYFKIGRDIPTPLKNEDIVRIIHSA